MSNPGSFPAFENVCSNYSTAILTIIRRFNWDVTVEKDLHQDVLLKMWRNWATFDLEKGGLYTWISIITTNICIDHFRKMRRKRLLDQPDPDLREATTLPGEADSAVHRHELMGFALHLSPEQRNVIVMIYFKGHTQREASSLLKVPLGTVKARQRSALSCLRKMYGNIF